MNDAEKARLRREWRQRLRHFDPGAGAAASAAIAARVRSLPEWARARRLAAYMAVPGEPDPQALLREHLARGGQLYLPRYEEPLAAYQMVAVHDLDHDLGPGRWQIPEPRRELPAAPENGGECDLWLVPGAAFDDRGARLGRGGGFYDRLLAGARGCKLALAWDWQLLPAVPAAGHDVRMDLVATEARLLDCRTTITR